MLKLRLQRHGRKQYAFYHIVAADSRAPRDGKFVERIGSYNPNTNPATIELNLDKAVAMLKNGAQPTDTVRAILSYKGAMYKLHLDKGVAKGALTPDQAETKFQEWLNAKLAKVRSKADNLKSAKEKAKVAALAAESKANADRAARIEAKNSPLANEPVAEESAAETSEEVVAEASAAEEVVAETAAAEETVAEAPAVEAAPVAEEPVAEAPAEEPAAETEANPEA